MLFSLLDLSPEVVSSARYRALETCLGSQDFRVNYSSFLGHLFSLAAQVGTNTGIRQMFKWKTTCGCWRQGKLYPSQEDPWSHLCAVLWQPLPALLRGCAGIIGPNRMIGKVLSPLAAPPPHYFIGRCRRCSPHSFSAPLFPRPSSTRPFFFFGLFPPPFTIVNLFFSGPHGCCSSTTAPEASCPRSERPFPFSSLLSRCFFSPALSVHLLPSTS